MWLTVACIRHKLAYSGCLPPVPALQRTTTKGPTEKNTRRSRSQRSVTWLALSLSLGYLTLMSTMMWMFERAITISEFSEMLENPGRSKSWTVITLTAIVIFMLSRWALLRISRPEQVSGNCRCRRIWRPMTWRPAARGGPGPMPWFFWCSYWSCLPAQAPMSSGSRNLSSTRRDFDSFPLSGNQNQH